MVKNELLAMCGGVWYAKAVPELILFDPLTYTKDSNEGWSKTEHIKRNTILARITRVFDSALDISGSRTDRVNLLKLAMVCQYAMKYNLDIDKAADDLGFYAISKKYGYEWVNR